MLKSYSLIKTSDNIEYEFNKKVLSLLDVDLLIEEEQLDSKVIEKLLERKRLHYSKTLLNYFISSGLDVVMYLNNLYEINGLMKEELEYIAEKLQTLDLIRYCAFISNYNDF